MSIRILYRKLKARCRLYRKINWSKSLYFNFKYFSFSTACKLPILFYGRVHFGTLRGCITLPDEIHMGMIGFGQPYELVTRARGIAQIHIEGQLIFNPGECAGMMKGLNAIGVLDTTDLSTELLRF